MQPQTPEFARAASGPESELTWKDRAFAWRDRMCASSRFQHWIATFPLTRRTARRHARAAFDICAGFVYSQILAACIELRLLELLSERPRTAADLAAETAVPLPAMERLLAAAAALDLVSRRTNQRWGLGTTGAGIAGTPGLSSMIKHHALFYADLRDPVALLRGRTRETHLAGYWPYAVSADPTELQAESVKNYSRLMAQSQVMISHDIIESYPFRKHRQLLDVGGGEGAFVSAVAAATPDLDLAIFDLPAVAALAERALAENRDTQQIKVFGGDFFHTPLPRGADLISLIRILHDHDDGAALALLRNIHAALPPGGTLLLAEPMSATPGGETMGDAYFGFYLLAMGSGRPRTPAEIAALLSAAGFRKSKMLRTARPILVRAVVATA